MARGPAPTCPRRPWVAVEQNVRRFHIAVQDAVPMGGAESIENLPPDIGDTPRGQWTVGLDDMRKRTATDELHDDPRPPA